MPADAAREAPGQDEGGQDDAPAPSDGGFRALALRQERVERADRLAVRGDIRVYRAADGWEVALPECIIARAFALARLAEPAEWIAVFTGRVCDDALGRHAIVDGVVPDELALSTRSSVETSTASESTTRGLARRLYPDGVVLGWVHSHPDGPCAFSSVDRRNQATWTQPHAVGVVLDLTTNAIAVYRGPGCERLSRVVPTSTGPADRLPRPEPRKRSPKVAILSLVLAFTFTAWVWHHLRSTRARLDGLAKDVADLRAESTANATAGDASCP